MPVSISGTGSITCVGRGTEALWQSALQGRSGLLDGLGYVPQSDLKLLPEVHPANRSAQFAAFAMREAMQMAGWQRLEPDDGLILATTTGQIPLWNSVLREYLNGEVDRASFIKAFKHQPLGDLLSHVAETFDFKGPRLLVTSACSASTQALALGAMWLKQGRAKRVLVGGVEVLCDLTINGFKCLQLLSEKAAKPFDAFRSGINLSEGAGFVCLELNPKTALATLSGYGVTSDGYHMTAPHPEGRGCYEAMRLSLERAGLKPSDIDWIHAHGTGSTHNDLAEGSAIRALFPNGPWVSSSKWVHGHTLGASGAIETVLCVEALRHQTLLKTQGLQNPDSAIQLNHPKANLALPLHHILKNTLGFGGTNAAVILSAAMSPT